MNAVVKKTNKSDQALIQDIRDDDKEAFGELFFRYYDDLCAIASKVTQSSDQARDVVQEVFLGLWSTRETWQVTISLKAYLFQAVWNEALNAKKKQKNRRELTRKFARYKAPFTESIHEVALDENTLKLIESIWEVVSEMPERRRFVFTQHRKEGLSYKEIGRVMGISRKTVENHMGLALKEIRDAIDPRLLK